MGGERNDTLVTCETMAAVTSSPTFRPHHQSLQTPSPFSISSTSATNYTFILSFHGWNLVLRSLALVLSFVSALSMAVPSATNTAQQQSSSFTTYPELVYCFVVAILVFLYSVFQLFKGVCDISHRGLLVSDKVFDYTSFILDQLVGYLLISSSSIAIPVIQRDHQDATLMKAAIFAAAMSSTAFLVIVICGLLSGYKLCKRITW